MILETNDLRNDINKNIKNDYTKKYKIIYYQLWLNMS